MCIPYTCVCVYIYVFIYIYSIYIYAIHIYIYIIVYRNSMEFHCFSAKKTTSEELWLSSLRFSMPMS